MTVNELPVLSHFFRPKDDQGWFSVGSVVHCSRKSPPPSSAAYSNIRIFTSDSCLGLKSFSGQITTASMSV